jgi:predicted small lipoprotein YifL
MLLSMLTRRAFVAATPAALAVLVAACGSKGDLVLPRAGAGPQAPPAATMRSPRTVVPIQPAIPSPPAIPPETLPPPEPKQP